jgi:hypothetical protein
MVEQFYAPLPFYREPRLREAAPHSLRPVLERSAIRGRKLAPHQVGDAGVQVAQRALDGQVQAARRLRRIHGGEAVRSGDDDEVAIAAIIRHGARHAQLADHLRGWDERLAADVAAALGQHLVLDVRRRHATIDVQLGGALHVEDVAVAAIHVHDQRRDLEVPWSDALPRVSHGLRQLELAEGAHGAPSGIGDLRTRVEVHVGGAEVADGEAVATEVDRLEAVVHGQLRAHRVVHARTEQVRLRFEQAAHARRRVVPARGRNAEAAGQQRCLDQLRRRAGGPRQRHHGRVTRCRDRGRTGRGSGTPPARPRSAAAARSAAQAARPATGCCHLPGGPPRSPVADLRCVFASSSFHPDGWCIISQDDTLDSDHKHV